MNFAKISDRVSIDYVVIVNKPSNWLVNCFEFYSTIYTDCQSERKGCGISYDSKILLRNLEGTPQIFPHKDPGMYGDN